METDRHICQYGAERRRGTYFDKYKVQKLNYNETFNTSYVITTGIVKTKQRLKSFLLWSSSTTLYYNRPSNIIVVNSIRRKIIKITKILLTTI